MREPSAVSLPPAVQRDDPLSHTLAAPKSTGFSQAYALWVCLLSRQIRQARSASWSARPTAAPRDGFVEVSVTDTGVGIAPEDQEAVFEEFRQVGTADKKVEGTGLG